MKKIARILPLVGILCLSLYAYEYVYPVGAFVDSEGETGVLSLYQKTPDHTELWQTNLVSGEVNRALLSTFTPVGVAMLPYNAGFSFFDNGRLRIKNFLKRSPKAIDIYEPVYDIGPLKWVTPELCIFHAKEREEFSLYQLCTSDGSVTKIVSKEAFDCFYPSQIGSSLFYIEHSHEQNNKKSDYTLCLQLLTKVSENDEEKSTRYCLERCCLVTHDKPLAFLTMFDQHHGLVIEHAGNIDSQEDKVLGCTCYQVLCDEAVESATLVKLFNFTLPLSLLLPSSQARLCESIYPLLPAQEQETIYFVSCVEDELRPFYYTQATGVQSLCLSTKVLGDIFTPLCLSHVKTQCLYGGSLQREFFHDDQEPPESLELVTL